MYFSNLRNKVLIVINKIIISQNLNDGPSHDDPLYFDEADLLQSSGFAANSAWTACHRYLEYTYWKPNLK